MHTFYSAWESDGGTAKGAETLRFALATAVLAYHSACINGPEHAIVAQVGGKILVPAFMALSGFLLAASALRSNWQTFAINRALRIYPGLIAVTLLAVLVLGPLLTTIPLQDYFGSHEFWRYLLSAAGLPSFTLPGVFEELSSNHINDPLWSITVELECYLALGILIALGAVRRRGVMLILLIATLALTSFPVVTTTGAKGLSYYVPLFLGQWPFFLAGGVLFLFREWVPRHIGLFWLSVGLIGLCMMASLYAVALPLLIAYSTTYLATASLPRPAFLSGGDYSYGIYIYGAPIQQAVQLISPRIPWVNFILAAPLVFAFAVGSWEFVEKPMLSLKRGFKRPSGSTCRPSAVAQSRRQWNQNVAA